MPSVACASNWEQRVGYLAVSDLDGSPYLHLCENRSYELLSADELNRLIDEIGPLGDRLEKSRLGQAGMRF